MAFLRRIRSYLTHAAHAPLRFARGKRGIALFMVLASVSVLAIIVTDFTYIVQVSQAISYGGLDQAQAHYLAKSGLKISLLRLKLYKQAISNPAIQKMAQKSILEKIWNFPLSLPLSSKLPGVTSGDQDIMKKFEKELDLPGRVSMTIESESSKYNLNMIVPNFGPSPLPSPGGAGGPPPPPPPGGGPPPTDMPPRESLEDYLEVLLAQKNISDPEFAMSYRDYRLNDLVDQLAGWSDRTYERRTSTSLDPIPMKRAPFYSITELHNLGLMDDDLYELFEPNLTASLTDGINVNTIEEATLRAIAPNLTQEEATEFFKFRDSTTADNFFKKEDDFFNYLQKSTATYRSDEAIRNLKNNLKSRKISLVTEESQFKITSQATVNSATRTIIAWVSLTAGTDKGDPGVKITHMRIY